MNNQAVKAAQEAVTKSEEFDIRWLWFSLLLSCFIQQLKHVFMIDCFEHIMKAKEVPLRFFFLAKNTFLLLGAKKNKWVKGEGFVCVKDIYMISRCYFFHRVETKGLE